MSAPERIWPDSLMIRDTGLHDDMGGGGRRIYTTAGRGYERKEYTRGDLCDPKQDERVRALVKAAQAQLDYMDMCNDTGDLERNLRAALSALEQGNP